MASQPNQECKCGSQKIEFLNGSKAGIACFVDALQRAPPLTQHTNGIQRFKLCRDSWCVVCLSTELQRQTKPQSCHRPATLKERVTLQLGATFAGFENGQERIDSTEITIELKNDLKATMTAITSWYDRHFWILGVSTICFLPTLHWKKDSIEVDYEKTAHMIVTNDGLSATEVRFPFAAAYDYEIHEVLWDFLTNELQEYWTNHWGDVLQFRALRLNAFQPLQPLVNDPPDPSHSQDEKENISK